MEDLQEQLKNIKTEFRLSMNGVISQSMREKGINYKINFGIELPRIKEIATHYPKNHALAQALWKEEIRESKLLATMLQPIETFYPEIADIWLENTSYSEIVEVAVMSLFQYLPYAPAKSFEWIADEREIFQQCGFLLIARLFMQGMELSERAEAEFLDQAQVGIETKNTQLRRVAGLALKKYGLSSEKNTKKVIRLLDAIHSKEDTDIQYLKEDIKSELEYLL